MESMLEFARGPLFTATFIFLVLGLLRVVVLQLLEMGRAWNLTADHDFPWKKNIKEFFWWTTPNKRPLTTKPVFSVVSILFHVGMILVPIFYLGHIVLWKEGLGISWPGFGREAADVLTLITVAGGVIILGYRIFVQSFRDMSSGMDYLLLLLILAIFLSGFFVSHPTVSPLAYTPMMLIHVLSAEISFLLLPFTKLAHAVLFPFGRMSSDFYWKLSEDGARKVARAMRGDDLKA